MTIEILTTQTDVTNTLRYQIYKLKTLPTLTHYTYKTDVN